MSAKWEEFCAGGALVEARIVEELLDWGEQKAARPIIREAKDGFAIRRVPIICIQKGDGSAADG